MPPSSRRVAVVHGAVPQHDARSRVKPDGDDAAVRARELVDGLVEKPALLGRGARAGLVGKPPEGAAQLGEYALGVPEVEKLGGGRVHSLDECDLERPREPRDGHPEVVAHEQKGLQSPTVAMAEGADELSIGDRRDGFAAIARTGR